MPQKCLSRKLLALILLSLLLLYIYLLSTKKVSHNLQKKKLIRVSQFMRSVDKPISTLKFEVETFADFDIKIVLLGQNNF